MLSTLQNVEIMKFIPRHYLFLQKLRETNYTSYKKTRSEKNREIEYECFSSRNNITMHCNVEKSLKTRSLFLWIKSSIFPSNQRFYKRSY